MQNAPFDRSCLKVSWGQATGKSQNVLGAVAAAVAVVLRRSFALRVYVAGAVTAAAAAIVISAHMCKSRQSCVS